MTEIWGAGAQVKRSKFTRCWQKDELALLPAIGIYPLWEPSSYGASTVPTSEI